MRYAILLFIYAINISQVFAQAPTAKPRTQLGLCLSGGGAKGLAHIGILKVLDELGVKPDYITGTSMGSIIGALYAMGYSADSIEKIARTADWPMLLSNRVPYDRITAEEKDESGKYLIEIPYKNFKLSPPAGLIEGQYIIEFLTQLALPVYCIDSFSRFNIPFMCIGADIVTGEAVQLKGGFLPDALRASMSIPTVFAPVKVNNRLLVDGGLINNFPVKDLKEMGAEIVLGSYTGGNLYGEEEIINSPVKLIYQSSSFVRIAASNEAKQLCRIVIDPEFGKLTIADFYKADSIINLGIKAAYAQKDEIKKILDSLGIEQYKRHIQLPVFNDSLEISSIQFKGSISNTYTLSKQRFNIPKKTSIHQLQTAVQNLYGTRYFDRVTYSLQPVGNEFNLKLLVKEAANAHFKMALHYDNELKTGFIINGTIRNLLGKSSRLLLSADISENPKLNLHYYKYFGTSENYWFTGQFYADRNIITTYENGNILGDLINQYAFIKLGINRTLNINSYVQIYTSIQSSNLEERASGKLFYTDGEFSKIKEKYWSIGFESSNNTTKQRYFPKSGKILLFKYGMHINLQSKTILDNGTTFSHVENLPMHRFQMDIKNHKPISKRITFITALKGSGILDNNYLISEQQYGGGYERSMRSLIEFDGYRNYELGGAYALAGKIEFQFDLYRGIYLQSRLNYGVFSNNFDKFFTNVLNPIYNLENSSFHTFSYGLNLAGMSPIGPIQIGMGEAYPLKKTRFYISIGHKF